MRLQWLRCSNFSSLQDSCTCLVLTYLITTQEHPKITSAVPKMQLLEVKLYFNDAGRLDTSAQDILLSWHVVGSPNAAQTVQKTTYTTNTKRPASFKLVKSQCRDGVLENCPLPREHLEDKKSWPWPWPQKVQPWPRRSLASALMLASNPSLPPRARGSYLSRPFQRHRFYPIVFKLRTRDLRPNYLVKL